jgi:VanZ family protein
LLVLLSHGALVEVLQSLVPDRSADAWDMVADAIGIAMALVASRLGLRVLGASQQTG